MNEQRWKATWRDQGGEREYLFSAPDNRAVARVDFQLKLMAQGKPVPRAFELEEWQQSVQTLSVIRGSEKS